jgi:hypothetical protein
LRPFCKANFIVSVADKVKIHKHLASLTMFILLTILWSSLPGRKRRLDWRRSWEFSGERRREEG